MRSGRRGRGWRWWAGAAGVALLVAIGGGGGVWSGWWGEGAGRGRRGASDVGAGGGSAPAGRAGTAAAGREAAAADGLHDPAGGVERDLAILQDVLQQYRYEEAGRGNPVGGAAEVAAALLAPGPGGGPGWIDPARVAVDAEGRILDRWGTPYFFHALAGDQMEIRSAGPDRQLWTADDVVDPGGDPDAVQR